MVKSIVTYPEENPRWLVFKNLWRKLSDDNSAARMALPSDKTGSQKFLDFLEHPLFTLSVGSLFGLIGMFYPAFPF